MSRLLPDNCRNVRITSRQLYIAIFFWGCLARPEELIGSECDLPSGSDALVRGLCWSASFEACLGDASERVEARGFSMTSDYT